MKTRSSKFPALLLLLAGSPLACAHGTHHGAGAAPEAGVASSFDAPGKGGDVQDDAQDDGGGGGAGSASAMLEQALDALQAERPAEATRALRAALATGDLNEAGRTVAYWYLYVAEQAQQHAQPARDALADFVAVGEDVLQQRDDVRFAERGGSDFVDRFDLEGRLARSRATLSLAWASQVPAFGRDAAHAVPVRDAQEMAFFLELAPPCAHHLDVRATEQVLGGGHVTRVELFCEGLKTPARYFFNTPVVSTPSRKAPAAATAGR